MISKLQWILVNLVAITMMFIYINISLRELRTVDDQRSLKHSRLATRSGGIGDSRSYATSIVIYNRIPKTGSTTLTNALMYDLCRLNGFNVVHLNLTRNRYLMNIIDQRRFIDNITNWSEKLPAVYHGHVAFIDFTRFGIQNPVYINLVREPLDRMISYYYFLRYGDDYRVGLKRSRAGDNQTFDECIEAKGRDCDPKHIWLQVPYFCGHHFFCSEVGSNRALEQAKRNLVEHYLLVGITEQMRDFIALLEFVLPNFFKGSLSHFDHLEQVSAKRANLRHTNRKISPNDSSLRRIMQSAAYTAEREFYEFARTQFNDVREKIMKNWDNRPAKQQFHFEKIKP